MKVLAALIAITPILASTYSPVSDSMPKSMKSNEMIPMMWRNLNETSTSMQCESDQEVLDGIMSGKLKEYQLNSVVDIDTLPDGCNFEEIQERYSCDFKNGQFSRDYGELCMEAGGVFEEFDVDLQCSGLFLLLKAAPGCVSNSCDIGEYITYNEEAFNATLPTEGTELTCNREITEAKDESSAEVVMSSKWKFYAFAIPIIINLL